MMPSRQRHPMSCSDVADTNPREADCEPRLTCTACSWLSAERKPHTASGFNLQALPHLSRRPHPPCSESSERPAGVSRLRPSPRVAAPRPSSLHPSGIARGTKCWCLGSASTTLHPDVWATFPQRSLQDGGSIPGSWSVVLCHSRMPRTSLSPLAANQRREKKPCRMRERQYVGLRNKHQDLSSPCSWTARNVRLPASTRDQHAHLYQAP